MPAIHPARCSCTACTGPRRPGPQRPDKAGRAEFIANWSLIIAGCAAFWIALACLFLAL